MGTVAAQAQAYPSRPITFIVPFAPGGPTDTVARIMADRMKDTLGQTVIIENVAGAGSTLGTGRAIAATPDGYTFIVGNWSSHVGAGALYPVNWHIVRDMEPIAQLSTSALMIVGRNGLQPNNIKELIAWLKANPGKATAVSVGAGSGAHICGLYFMEKTGTNFLFAQYRGGGPAMIDLVGNQIDLMCAEASQTLEHVRGGKMKAFVVMSPGRWAPLPDVPTMVEIGLDMQIPFWHGLWGPRGLPKAVIDKVNAAAVAAFADPAVQKRIADLGQTIPPSDQLTPEALAAYHKVEVDKWWPIIKAANIKMQ
ncbi:MAG: tripartite tricarboxylate transporter substrate binding protein BugD [Xanthobacteraceae bacterium]|nr:tripartite tricarboxylate transporter substrate binding protein BugD [Xanthobacteraceae bacterium]